MYNYIPSDNSLRIRIHARTYLYLYIFMIRKLLYSVSRDVNRSYYRDRSIFSRILQSLNLCYYDSKIQDYKNQEEQKTSDKVKNDFKDRFSFSIPWIDSGLLSTVENNLKRKIEFTPRIPKISEVKDSDKESIRQYTTNIVGIRRSCLHSFTFAALRAAADLGLVCLSEQEQTTVPLISIEQALELSIKDSNSGYPTRKNKKDKEAINDAVQWNKRLFSNSTVYGFMNNILLKNPIWILHRSQLKDESLGNFSVAVRQVWNVPFRIIIMENVFFRSLLNISSEYNLNNLNPISSSGLRNSQISDRIISRFRSYVNLSNNSNKSIFSIDYSKFDRTVPDFAIDLFFAICKTRLSLNKSEDKLFGLLRFYTKYSPVVNDGIFFLTTRGVSSGSLLTNILDSWWNLTLWYLSHEISTRSYYDLDRLDDNLCIYPYTQRSNIAVCGDDVIIYTHKYEVMIHERLCNYLGMKVTSKDPISDNHTPIYFLGRFWDEKSRPFQTEKYLIYHSIFRTRFFKKEETPFDISEKLNGYRLISIYCQFYNGYNLMLKHFKGEPSLENVLRDQSILQIKDWPFKKYETIPIRSIGNWRMF